MRNGLQTEMVESRFSWIGGWGKAFQNVVSLGVMATLKIKI
jgi:hypothetical protein